LANDLEPRRPGDEGVAFLLDPPGVGDNRIDPLAETEKLPPELGSILRWRWRRSRSRSQPPLEKVANRLNTRRPRFGLRRDRIV
jgi:hypothetical protein